MKDTLRDAALEYHRLPTPGKIAIVPTKAMATQRDLSLAYSPGVAAPCEEIAADPLKALDYTSRGNLVAVISNGTAVLGLGDIGALASKPVMEGKSVLFKKFANIDSIDIEIDEKDPKKLIEIIAALEPSFGGINLEDIKAPECFEVETELRKRMKIPVFHDDQHGTAIITTAAITNWLHLKGRTFEDIKLVANGAGAAALACLNLLVQAGLPKKNIIVCDRKGVIYKGRKEQMDPYKEQYAVETNARTLAEALEGADIFLGLSAAKALNGEMVKKMGKAPLIMALANPVPEIMPEEAKAAKPDAIICTGRSDYTNQVNNVLCFPFLFRGALDVGATAINEEMKMACANAIASLARREVSPEVASVYSEEKLEFGPDYLIPKPFDPRLIVELPMAVARTAMETGVAARPIADWEAYRQKLQSYTYRTSMVMRPIFARAKQDPKRVVYCEGEEDRVLQAVQTVLDDGIAKPILIGRKEVIETRIKRLGLRMKVGKDFELVDPEYDHRYREYWTSYHEIMERRGVNPAVARTTLRTDFTVIGSLMVRKGDADAMICGTVGQYKKHLKDVVDVIGMTPGVDTPAAMNVMILSKGAFFICDTQINPTPSAAQICEVALLAAHEVARFGIKPKVALLSHSNFGTHDDESACRMRAALAEIRRRAPGLEIDGEMHADDALSETIRRNSMPNSTLEGAANLLIMPNVDAANIAFNMMKILGDGIGIGPILLGAAMPAHILTPSATARGILNMTAFACVDAQSFAADMQSGHLHQRALAF
ncbi:MAG: NADP-dependent malic enzyme [Micavibrio aeruginosavorus]|nr:NADP-dependent malic enzyme [Micavibrio aeruginosavorus]